MIQLIQKIGSSSGILLPEAMLQACGISQQVEVEVQQGSILLRPVAVAPRAGWEAAFAAAVAAGELPEPDMFAGLPNEFDHTEW